MNPEKIHKNVQNANHGNITIFCLGFGYDVKFGFLEVMAKQNNGVARRIYEASDAVVQLQVRTSVDDSILHSCNHSWHSFFMIGVLIIFENNTSIMLNYPLYCTAVEFSVLLGQKVLINFYNNNSDSSTGCTI